MPQLTSRKQCCAYMSKQSCLLSALIPHARLRQPSSSRRMSPLEALGGWRTVTTVSACLLFSLRLIFQSRHDRNSATRFNPRQQQWKNRTASRSCDHSDDCILSWAASRSPNDECSWSVGHIPPDWLCTTGQNTGQWNPRVYTRPALPVSPSSFLFLSVCLAWRPAFCLSECLLKLLMRCQQARGIAVQSYVFIALDRKSESSWLTCLWNCFVTEQWCLDLNSTTHPPVSSSSHQTPQGVKKD